MIKTAEVSQPPGERVTPVVQDAPGGRTPAPGGARTRREAMAGWELEHMARLRDGRGALGLLASASHTLLGHFRDSMCTRQRCE